MEPGEAEVGADDEAEEGAGVAMEWEAGGVFGVAGVLTKEESRWSSRARFESSCQMEARDAWVLRSHGERAQGAGGEGGEELGGYLGKAKRALFVQVGHQSSPLVEVMLGISEQPGVRQMQDMMLLRGEVFEDQAHAEGADLGMEGGEGELGAGEACADVIANVGWVEGDGEGHGEGG